MIKDDHCANWVTDSITVAVTVVTCQNPDLVGHAVRHSLMTRMPDRSVSTYPSVGAPVDKVDAPLAAAAGSPALQALGVLCSSCHGVVPLLLFANSPSRPRRAHCPHCTALQELTAE